MITNPSRLLTLSRVVVLAATALVVPLFTPSALARADEGRAAASPAATLKRFSDAAVIVLSDPGLSDETAAGGIPPSHSLRLVSPE
jgi:hypothetical protein